MCWWRKIRTQLVEISPGETWDSSTSYSPIISEKQLERIEDVVKAAQAQGAEILAGGGRIDRAGYFYRPTLIGSVGSDLPAVTQEIFGPVLTVQSFETEEDAVALANRTTYGLCAGIYTRDLSRAVRMSRSLEAGTVWVNRYGRSRDHILPTGGFRGSGLGKDLGRQAYRDSRRTKSVLVDL